MTKANSKRTKRARAAQFKPTRRTAAKEAKPSAFNAAHKRWLKTQAAWRAIEGVRLTDAAHDRLVDKRHTAREQATDKLARIKARDVPQLASKTEALSDMLLSDFKNEAALLHYGAYFQEEAWGLLKSIRRDAAHLARGRSC